MAVARTGPTFDYRDCRVLVTGGSNGIGADIARAFLHAGAGVTITGTRPQASDYDADLSPFDYRCLQMEDRDAIDALPESLDGLDVLVNNAGQPRPRPRRSPRPSASGPPDRAGR